MITNDNSAALADFEQWLLSLVATPDGGNEACLTQPNCNQGNTMLAVIEKPETVKFDGEMIRFTAGRSAAMEQARQAIKCTLEKICCDPACFFLMGSFTESYTQLTAAYAALTGISLEQVRANFQPDEVRYRQFCERQKEEQCLLRYCAAKWIWDGN